MKLLALALLAPAAASGPPDGTDAVALSRWMAAKLTWGTLSTTSTRSNGSQVGDAFGNPYSFADVGGVPYIYASNLDASAIDLFTAPDASPIGSLALSEATLPNTGLATNATDAACVVGASTFGDPENPPCARLVLTGAWSKPAAGSDEYEEAYAALEERHPYFKELPSDHDFYVAKMTVTGVWLIGAYGGASVVEPEEYFAAPEPERAAQVAAAAPAPLTARPWFWNHVAVARWMAETLDWGVLSTTSTRTEGTAVGDAFGNPYSFAEVGGVPYFYGSTLDASMTDAFAGAGASPRASLSLSEAELSGDDELSSCRIGAILGDPENPPCARLVLSGALVNVSGTPEGAAAWAALVAKHPSFADYPASHDFFVSKLDVDALFFIDMFGGADYLDPAAYLANSTTA